MKTVLYFIAAVLLFSCGQKNSEIYQWRGKGRTGIYQETSLQKTWPEEGPRKMWMADSLGDGYGSPTVTDKEIFITGEVDSMAWLYCFDLNGELRWKKCYGKEWAKHYPGSRSAPTVVGDLIYTGTGMGIIACLDRNDGAVVWSRDYVTDFGGTLPMHGYSEAPVIFEDQVFCTPGTETNNIIALNRFTGEPVWSCPGLGERMAYNPGQIIELPERKIFVTFSAYHLLGIDAYTGALLWSHSQDNIPMEKRQPGMGDVHSNNILFEDGYIYYAAGTGNGGVRLQLSSDGSKITEEWRYAGFDSYIGGFVKSGDYLYGCGFRKKDLRSISASSGQLVDSLRIGAGALIATDSLLFYYTQRGELHLVSYDQGKLTQQGSIKVAFGSGEHFSHPVIKNGVLYQRRGNTLAAFNIKEEPGDA